MRLDLTSPVTIAYRKDVYTSFPDILRLSSGELVCIYRESDEHHPTTSTILISRSLDEGETWQKEVFAESSLKKDGFVFNCPRINKVGKDFVIVTDTKSSQNEGACNWATIAWQSLDCKNWNKPRDLGIAGMVPDKIISFKRFLAMGYHTNERNSEGKHQLIQMMALSRDQGRTWRDRLTIATAEQNDFCEGSLVYIKDNQLFCYLRDNRVSVTRGYLTISYDLGMNWIQPAPLSIHAHRVVAGIKRYEPYKDAIVGTYRNTARRAVEIFIQNPNVIKLQSFPLATESKEYLFDFGYTGWVEFEDGSLGIVYYISGGQPNPKVCFVRATFCP